MRQPPVLLLDECTSALDPLTQEAVQKTILKDFPRPGWLENARNHARKMTQSISKLVKNICEISPNSCHLAHRTAVGALRTTTIAVAHRLETIMSFDKVVVFDVGKVVETGTVEQLKKANGAFTRMLKAGRELGAVSTETWKKNGQRFLLEVWGQSKAMF